MSDFITLTCPSCGGKMEIPQESPRYRCMYCGNEHILREAAPQPTGIRSLARAVAARPAEISIEKESGAVRLVRRWFSAKYIPLAFFCIAWDSFLVFWYGIAFSMKAPWIMIVFPIAHLAVGVGLTYSVLAGFFNRSYLELTRKELAVWHGPLPWGGAVTLPTADIRQLYTQLAPGKSSDSSASYHLFAITQDGRSHKLFSNLETPDVALFMEQQVERWLRIEDRPVAGELPR